MAAGDTNFAGSIPALYERYLGPFIFHPYAQDLAERVQKLAPSRVLETAAGTGIVTRALAAALPGSAEIIATDLNQAMLDMAASKVTAHNVSWKQADAQALPFEAGSFDVVVCQFGAMFFPDKEQGYREARRVLRNGGVFLFNVWDRIEANEIPHLIAETAKAAFPDDPPRFLERTPHGYHDVSRIRDELRRAGFSHTEVETVEKISRAASAREPAVGFCQGTPLRNEIEARDRSRLEEITDRAAEAVAARYSRAEVSGKISAHVFTAAN
jgi:ubiquinone/menaquinone biosynthesis C-methylase UbiE